METNQKNKTTQQTQTERPKWINGKEFMTELSLINIEPTVKKEKDKDGNITNINIEYFTLVDENKEKNVRYSPVKYEKTSELDVSTGIELYEDNKRMIMLSELDEFFPDFREIKKIIEHKKVCKIQLVIQPSTRTEDEKTFYKTFYDNIKNLTILKK